MRKNFPVIVADTSFRGNKPKRKNNKQTFFKAKKNLETSMGENRGNKDNKCSSHLMQARKCKFDRKIIFYPAKLSFRYSGDTRLSQTNKNDSLKTDLLYRKY